MTVADSTATTTIARDPAGSFPSNPGPASSGTTRTLPDVPASRVGVDIRGITVKPWVFEWDQLPNRDIAASGPPYVLHQKLAEALCGHPLPAELFRWPVFGHRILAVMEKPRRRYGAIEIPRQFQKRPTRGVVIAAGELVGTPWGAIGSDCIAYWPIRVPVYSPDGAFCGYTNDPASLLGQQITFTSHAGTTLVIEPDERSESSLKDWAEATGLDHLGETEAWYSPYKLMTDNEILNFNWVPLPADRPDNDNDNDNNNQETAK